MFNLCSKQTTGDHREGGGPRSRSALQDGAPRRELEGPAGVRPGLVVAPAPCLVLPYLAHQRVERVVHAHPGLRRRLHERDPILFGNLERLKKLLNKALICGNAYLSLYGFSGIILSFYFATTSK